MRKRADHTARRKVLKQRAEKARARQCGRTGPPPLQSSKNSVGESRSASVTSSLEDLAAVGGFHSLTEAVDFLSLQFLGLVGSFHYISPPFIKTKYAVFAPSCPDAPEEKRGWRGLKKSENPQYSSITDSKGFCQPFSRKKSGHFRDFPAPFPFSSPGRRKCGGVRQDFFNFMVWKTCGKKKSVL